MPPIDGLRGTAAVTRVGEAAREFAGGLADAQTGAACTPETVFQISSLSKQFAAVTILMLAESGQLSLTAPLSEWFPGCPGQWQAVTLHHLLSHTAGVRHWDEETPGFHPNVPMDHGERIALLLQAPLVTEPGARFRYSSPGYLLAGRVVETVSGQTYPQALRERITGPLGMAATTVGAPPAGLARGYRGGEPVEPWDLSAMPGTGDICSTTADLARFLTGLHTGSLLAPQSLAQMRGPHAVDGMPATDTDWLAVEGYGYGLYTGTAGGQRVYLHTGDNPGYQSLAAWLPGEQRSVVILANDQASDMEDLFRQVLTAADSHDG